MLDTKILFASDHGIILHTLSDFGYVDRCGYGVDILSRVTVEGYFLVNNYKVLNKTENPDISF